MIDLYERFKLSVPYINDNLINSLNIIFSSNEEKMKILRNELIKSEYIGDILTTYNMSTSLVSKNNFDALLSRIFSCARSKRLKLEHPYFLGVIESKSEILNKILEDPNAYYGRWTSPREDYIAVIESAFISGKSIPSDAFYLRYSAKKDYLNDFDLSLLRSIAKHDISCLRSAAESNTFIKKYSSEYRSLIYNLICAYGEINNKVTKNIVSENCSCAIKGVDSLIRYKDRQKKDLNEIFTILVKVKTDEAKRHLASHIPKEYLAFMLTSNDRETINIIAKRMGEE